MIRFLTTTLFILASFSAVCLAQSDSSQNLYFVPNDREAIFKQNDYQPGKNAFYIYRNCIYDLVLKNKKAISIRVMDIRNDSIYYISAFNHSVAPRNNEHNDTLALHPLQLKKIRLIGDRILGLYSGYSLTNCRYVFEKSHAPKVFPVEKKVSYAADSSYSIAYELVSYLTAQGLDKVFEQGGYTYYYEGAVPEAPKDTLQKKGYFSTSPQKKKTRLVKNVVWFTPSNATEINGLNIGLQTGMDDGDPLVISGVNLNVDGLSAFIGMFGIVYLFANTNVTNIPDTVYRPTVNSMVTGLSLSIGGLMGNDMRVRGVSINGAISSVNKMAGLHITGTQNRTDEFSGVVITGITNRAIKGRGLQIGLLNVCKDLKGVQLGLWNVNGKRSLPFINWRF